MSYPRVVSLTLLVLVAVYGCAAGGTPGAAMPAPSSPMSAEDQLVFDDGADFVADPGGLQGQWFASWESDMEQRFERADLVALVGVGSIARSQVESDAEPTLVLVPEAQRVLRGSFPEDLTLVSTKGRPGYASLERGQSRLLDERFVLFVKWAEGSAGGVQARFHLSPAAGQVMQQVDARYGGQESDKRVVRHVN